ncbi:unnamed protein product [Tetraodon nigroviridis]|uniref:Chromosome 7 SCAF13760, whole genome shotgun sequence n=1 Tax=Tetraodon nigroviridis TaxID=99883 RepID=Q4SVF2_TETNG|nr:unnamed protein product [Tetraodon nigroviridis]
MEGVCAWLAGVCVLCVLAVSADTSLEAGDHTRLDHQHTHLVPTSNAASGRKCSRVVEHTHTHTHTHTFYCCSFDALFCILMCVFWHVRYLNLQTQPFYLLLPL